MEFVIDKIVAGGKDVLLESGSVILELNFSVGILLEVEGKSEWIVEVGGLNWL